MYVSAVAPMNLPRQRRRASRHLLNTIVERSRYAAGKIKDSVYYPYLFNSGHL
jgi:hypothetical protein